eukprot:TRINITY_DN29624_c0_g1_i1.p1 TRINITY_DN29624_c0_g1~~TRINITY_DN29624_c0_g1_i1.p1  ORF type:complete len:831 (+),score=63.34 TRINITY_DN29624_c0_g1_i1:125-2617(+)
MQQEVSSSDSQDKCYSVLKKFWNYDSFRFQQKEVINAVLSGKDSLVIWSTSSGKSLCYQIPPLIKGSPAIVICPLISLMQDQVYMLKQKGIRAEFLGSAQTNQNISQQVWRGDIDVVYITPESVIYNLQQIVQMKNSVGLTCVAVDEAHCVTEWGHQFRPEYSQLGQLKDLMPDVPILALTATARNEVKEDIMIQLRMDKENSFISQTPVFRKNLYIKVKNEQSKKEADVKLYFRDLIEEKQRVGKVGATIIYVIQKKEILKIRKCLEVIFRNESGQSSIGEYHGDMNLQERQNTQQAFMEDRLEVVVATIAFGMGINKQNIRNIWLWGYPSSLELFFQMAGRGGRDGLLSKITIIATNNDFEENLQVKKDDNRQDHVRKLIESMSQFCLNITECRHMQISHYFGDFSMQQSCGNMCDVCEKQLLRSDLQIVSNQQQDRQSTQDILTMLKVIRAMHYSVGLNKIISVLRGADGQVREQHRGLRSYAGEYLYGSGSDRSEQYWKDLFLEIQQKLYVDRHFYNDGYRQFPTWKISVRGLDFVVRMEQQDINLEYRLWQFYRIWKDTIQGENQRVLTYKEIKILSKVRPRKMVQFSRIGGLNSIAVNSIGPVLLEFFKLSEQEQQDDQVLKQMIMHRRNWLWNLENRIDKYFMPPTMQSWQIFSMFQEGSTINQISELLQQSQKLTNSVLIGEIANAIRVFGLKGVDIERLVKEAFVYKTNIAQVAQLIRSKGEQLAQIGSIVFYLDQEYKVQMDSGEVMLALVILKCKLLGCNLQMSELDNDKQQNINEFAMTQKIEQQHEDNDLQAVVKPVVKRQNKRKRPLAIAKSKETN